MSESKQFTGDEPDPNPEGRPEPPEVPRMCDHCDGDCHWGTVTSPLGTFCSDTCADAEDLAFEQHMRRRGHMTARGA